MWRGLWVIAPVLGAYLAHAPVLRFDLLRHFARPIDGGATLRGRRVFGDNKTWRGVVVMSSGVFTATLLLSLWPACSRHWPADLRSHRALFGLLLALGFVAGELPNSFVKRQFHIEPGSRRISPFGIALSIFDQADFVPAVWLTLSPLWLMSPVQALVVFVSVVMGHSVINVIGYAIGARKTWT
jgi:CDP-2,3-bis-(O-geranylgeranyl)-sn-glycerol synthase